MGATFMIDPTLRALLDRRNELKNELINSGIEIRNRKLQLIEEFFGVKLGSIVKYRGKEFKVVSIKVSTWNGRPDRIPWLVGVGRKKDGEFGVVQRNLFVGWELVKK